MPSVTAENFGAKNIGINYGILFTAFGAAAFVGPRLASVVKEADNGEYTMAFIMVAVINLIGMIFVIKAKRIQKKSDEVAA